MPDMKRGGFIGMIAAACAVPALEAGNPAPDRDARLKRVLVIYDVCLVAHKEAHELGRCLHGMGLEGPMMGVDLSGRGEPIRLLNIDELEPETVDSLLFKYQVIHNG